MAIQQPGFSTGGTNSRRTIRRPLQSLEGWKTLGNYGMNIEENGVITFNEGYMTNASSLSTPGYYFRDIPDVLNITPEDFQLLMTALISQAIASFGTPVMVAKKDDEGHYMVDENGEPILEKLEGHFNVNWNPASRQGSVNPNYVPFENLMIDIGPGNFKWSDTDKSQYHTNRYLVLAAMYEPARTASSPEFTNRQWMIRLAVKTVVNHVEKEWLVPVNDKKIKVILSIQKGAISVTLPNNISVIRSDISTITENADISAL